MPMSEEKKEELKEELPKVAVAGSSVRTRPGTDPDEAFDDVDSGDSSDSENDSESVLSRLSRWLYSL